MNKLLLILAVVILTVSCKEEPKPEPVTYEQKYPVGAVMYIKPDSLKVAIAEYNSYDNSYRVYWRVGGEYFDEWFYESGFYGEVITEETYE